MNTQKFELTYSGICAAHRYVTINLKRGEFVKINTIKNIISEFESDLAGLMDEFTVDSGHYPEFDGDHITENLEGRTIGDIFVDSDGDKATDDNGAVAALRFYIIGSHVTINRA